MPKSCEECSALHRPYGKGMSTFCHFNANQWIKAEDTIKRADFCPIKCDIEDIKAEIAEYKDDKVIHAERNEMIDIVLDLIDKHIGKESE